MGCVGGYWEMQRRAGPAGSEPGCCLSWLPLVEARGWPRCSSAVPLCRRALGLAIPSHPAADLSVRPRWRSLATRCTGECWATTATMRTPSVSAAHYSHSSQRGRNAQQEEIEVGMLGVHHLGWPPTYMQPAALSAEDRPLTCLPPPARWCTCRHAESNAAGQAEKVGDTTQAAGVPTRAGV